VNERCDRLHSKRLENLDFVNVSVRRQHVIIVDCAWSAHATVSTCGRLTKLSMLK
jgi:hypothetical protein